MKNELQRIKNKYITHGKILSCSKKIGNFLYKAITKAIENDAPDFYYLNNNICYCFEHFEFDASKKTRTKGSNFRKQEKEADKTIDLKSNELLSTKHAKENEITNYGTISAEIKSNYQKNFWKQNFIDVFLKHYNKLDEYRNNLTLKGVVNTNTKIKNIFVIEDVTEFGVFEATDKNKIFNPYDFDFCIDLLINSKNVDYFIFLNKSQQFVFIVNKTAIKNLKKCCYEFEKTEIFFFNNIQVISALIAIPQNILNKNNDIEE